MGEIVDDLRAQHAELDSLLASLDAAQWALPTRCDGWDVADVVLHLCQTDELALASVEERFDAGLDVLAGSLPHAADVDAGAGALVAAGRGAHPDELLARWRHGSRAVATAIAASDPRRRVRWVVGTLSAQTLAATRLSECWIHSGDIAEAVGVEQPPTDRLRHVARLAWRTLPYAFQRTGRALAGPVAFELTGPNGDAWSYTPDAEPATVITGSAAELCNVAAQRVRPSATSLTGTGPDVASVLELVRTYA